MDFETQVKKAIPALVVTISGSSDDQRNKEVFDVGELQLPKTAGKVGGYLTSAFLQVMRSKGAVTSDHVSYRTLVDGTQQILEDNGYNQVVQISSSRRLLTTASVDLFSSVGMKRAVLIGINYSGNLQQSHEHVQQMKEYLIKTHKFSTTKIDVLMDKDGCVTPSRKNILNSLKDLANSSKEGDVAFLLFCGHAGRVSDNEGYLIPCDFATAGHIREDELYKSLVCAMPMKSRLVCLFDLVNSGSMVDLPYTLSFKSNDKVFYQNAAFELSAVLGLAIVAGVGVGAGSGVGGDIPFAGCDDCCTGYCDAIFGG